MLPNSSHVQEVYCGTDGILSSVQQGSIMIDSSTIDPAVSKKVASEAEAKCSSYMDAPVSGIIVPFLFMCCAIQLQFKV